MNEITTVWFAYGAEYSYNDDKIEIKTGLLSKKYESVFFSDIKDIQAKSNIFGYGDIKIIDINGTTILKNVSDPQAVHGELDKRFIQVKKNIKKIDLS